MKQKSKILLIVFGILAIIGILSVPSIVEEVDNKEITVVQRVWTGKMEYWTKPGVHAQWFGKLTTYWKTNQVWFDQYEIVADGVIVPAPENGIFPITYADKGKGFIVGSVRIELPLNEAKLALLQQHYGSERRLIEELIKPTIGKVVLACGPVMTSLESVSEKRNDLIYYATDQLNKGIYATRAQMVERINPITGDVEKYQQAFIVTDSLGNPVRREESPFDKYGLTVSQLSIADLLYEPATNEQISKQRNAELEIISAKAEAAKAIQKTIQIEEEGKQDAAQAKWKQEAIKAAEVTKAQQAYEVAALKAKEADEIAKQILAEGRAQAEANRLKVAAGLTPLERANIEMQTTIGVAEALAKSQQRWVPEVMVNGGNGNNGSNALDAVGLKFLMEIANQKK